MTKALTFLDYVKSQPQFVSYSNGKADITDFYSQEFKPKMIVEYFELPNEYWKYYKNNGWLRDIKIYPDSENHYNWRIDLLELENPINTISVTGYDSYLRFVISGNAAGLQRFKPRDFVTPKTIDSFITSCHDAGIELNWKEEVVNKYFK